MEDGATDQAREEMTDSMMKGSDDHCPDLGMNKPSKSNHLKNRILNYLDENYANPEIYGKSVAEEFDINEKYLYTFFKEQTGNSFASYLETLRLSHAVRLLKTSRFSLGEIARMVGFHSSNTFYKAFRRVYGMPPSVYRNQIKESVD